MFRTPAVRRRASHLLVTASVAALAVQLAPPAPASASLTVPSGTIDAELRAALEAVDDAFFDVLVVFEARADVARLDELGVPARRYRHFPVARAALSEAEVLELAAAPGVLSIEANVPQPLHNAESRQLTGVDKVQATTRPADQRYEGAGVHVAVVDTGIDTTHPAFAGRIEHAWVYASPSPEGPGLSGAPDQHVDRSGYDGRIYVSSTRDGIAVHQTFVDALPREAGAAPAAPVNTDGNGHGTHVSGIVAGSGGSDRGVAPQARIHSYAIGPSTGAQLPVSFALEAYDHILSDPRIRVVNASIGIPDCTRGTGTVDWYRRANQTAMRVAALERGVLTVNSYANSGMKADGTENADTCTTLSLQPYILAVGGTTKGSRLWAASSRGVPPSAGGNMDRKAALKNLTAMLGLRPGGRAGWDGQLRPIALTRPGVVAPAARIVSTLNPSHGNQVLSSVDHPSAFYGEMSGTSQAAPHVAGIAVLALEAHRRAFHKDLTALELIQLLEESADRAPLFGYEPYQAGAGLVDAARAVGLAETRHTFHIDEVALVGGAATTADLAAGVLSGTTYPRATTVADREPAVHEVVVPAGAARLLVTLPPDQRAQLRVSLFRPGAEPGNDRPAADSGWNYFPVRNAPDAEVAFPTPGTWKVRVEVITTPGGPNSVAYQNVQWAAQQLVG